MIEIAIVITIVSVLLVIVAAPLAGMVERKRVEETQRTLEVAKDALYGFAAANGRLPCPATAASAGQEAPANGGVCTSAFGFLPAVTLGLTPIDEGGYLVDAWADGTALRRIRYAVSSRDSWAITTQNGIRNATMSVVAAIDTATPSTNPHLIVCATGLTGSPSANSCGSTTELTRTAPAVLYSLGKDPGTNSPDETNNQNGDIVFTSGSPTATFDDQVTWLSLNTLFNRMMTGQKLP